MVEIGINAGKRVFLSTETAHQRVPDVLEGVRDFVMSQGIDQGYVVLIAPWVKLPQGIRGLYSVAGGKMRQSVDELFFED